MQAGKAIAFASRGLADTKNRYANFELEILAVVVACDKFHSYIFGKKLTAESHHKPLEMIHLKNLTTGSPRLQDTRI